MRKAVGGPGIDPRIWLTLATVKECGFDAEEGIFVDIQYQPDGTVETAYLGQPYAGNAFGAHFPLEEGDTVLVAVPMGDPGNGPVIISRWHDSGDPPNAELGDGEDCTRDVVIRVKPDQKFILRTSGAGDAIDLKVEGDGPVNIETAAGDVNVKAAGNVNVEAQGNATVKAGGNASVDGALVNLGATEGLVPLVQGAVNGEAIDSFTGSTFAVLGNSSSKVLVKK